MDPTVEQLKRRIEVLERALDDKKRKMIATREEEEEQVGTGSSTMGASSMQQASSSASNSTSLSHTHDHMQQEDCVPKECAAFESVPKGSLIRERTNLDRTNLMFPSSSRG